MLPLSKKKKKSGSPSKAGEQGGTPLEAYNPASLWQTGPFRHAINKNNYFPLGWVGVVIYLYV